MTVRWISIILLALCSAACRNIFPSEPLPQLADLEVAKLPHAVVASLETRVPGAQIIRVEAWTYKGRITEYDITVLTTAGEKIYGLYPDGSASLLDIWPEEEMDSTQTLLTSGDTAE